MNNLQKFTNFFVSIDPHQKQLTKLGLFSNNFTETCLQKLLSYYKKIKTHNQQENFIKSIIKNLQSNACLPSKLKTISFLLEISKITEFDIAEIIQCRKPKFLNKTSNLKLLQQKFDKKNTDNLILCEIMTPLYNYILKLSVNQQLYKTCLKNEIPFDDIFRRGSKIRFIWIFKLYNLINIILPLLNTINHFIQNFPNFEFFKELSSFLYSDVVTLNNFIVRALYEASEGNFLIMPYFDMLQFYESMKEQTQIQKSIQNVRQKLTKYEGQINKNNLRFPQSIKFVLSNSIRQSIELQALRVKLISTSFKNPKKDHTILYTQYNSKIHDVEQKRLKTETSQITFNFQEKFRNLD